MEARSENLCTPESHMHAAKTSSVVALLTRISTLCRTLGGRHGSPLPMPIILYDGSEEELMDTIEREFS